MKSHLCSTRQEGGWVGGRHPKQSKGLTSCRIDDLSCLSASLLSSPPAVKSWLMPCAATRQRQRLLLLPPLLLLQSQPPPNSSPFSSSSSSSSSSRFSFLKKDERRENVYRTNYFLIFSERAREERKRPIKTTRKIKSKVKNTKLEKCYVMLVVIILSFFFWIISRELWIFSKKRRKRKEEEGGGGSVRHSTVK